MVDKCVVTVIVPVYHDWDRLKFCIDSLAKQSYPNEMYEVIIINNDPLDRPPKLDLPLNFILISEGRPGSYAARNAGLRIAKGDVVAFTDSDCIADKYWIENSVNRLVAGADRVAGRVKIFFESAAQNPIEVYEKAFAFDQEANARAGGAVTANMVTYTKNFDAVGGFDETLMSGGDNEWGWRAQELGLSVEYAPEALVKHPARSSLSEMLDKRRRIAGGLVSIRSKSMRRNILVLVVLGYLPPLKLITKAFRDSDLTFRDKIVSIAVAYYLKIYTTTYQIIYRFGLKQI